MRSFDYKRRFPNKQTTSLFAWVSQESPSQRFRGIMAKSPSEFAQCSALINYKDYMASQNEFTMINNRVRIEATLGFTASNEYVLDLNYFNLAKKGLGIFLRKTVSGFVRR